MNRMKKKDLDHWNTRKTDVLLIIFEWKKKKIIFTLNDLLKISEESKSLLWNKMKNVFVNDIWSEEEEGKGVDQ